MGASVGDTAMGADRLFEHTEASVKAKFMNGDQVDTGKLTRIPALVMPELQDRTRSQVAHVGCVESITRVGKGYHYRFVPDPGIPAIPSTEIATIALDLHIDDSGWGEFARTHWAIKDVDLYHALLLRENTQTSLAPKVFTIPAGHPDPDLVSIMMPFDPSFGPVYKALSDAAGKEGWRCQRVDDMWVNDAIINDIVKLIADSRVVICDLSGRNPNVFYETGIAHTIGRNFILLAQQDSDVPFDLRHLRFVKYLLNDQGVDKLVEDVLPRLRDLMNL
jgi:hypothetical protein